MTSLFIFICISTSFLNICHTTVLVGKGRTHLKTASWSKTFTGDDTVDMLQSGDFTVRFVSDYSRTRGGFLLEWNCIDRLENNVVYIFNKCNSSS